MRGEETAQSRKPQREAGDNTAGGTPATADWKEIKEALTNIKEGLEKEEAGTRFVEQLNQIIERVSHATRKPPATEMEARLERIEKILLEQLITQK